MKRMRRSLIIMLVVMLMLPSVAFMEAPRVHANQSTGDEPFVNEPIRVNASYGATVRGGTHGNTTVSGGSRNKETLEVKWAGDESFSRRSHLQFNMPNDVNWTNVERVMLVLYVTERFGTRNLDPVNVFQTDNPGISEENWTWNNTNSLMDDAELMGQNTFGASLNGTWVEMDVTSLVDPFKEGAIDSELFLALYPQVVDDQAGIIFASPHRAAGEFAPHLMIYEQYEDQLPPTVMVSGLTNGQMVTNEQLTFTINTADNVDTNPKISLIVNGNAVTTATQGANTITLLAGRNIIEISAEDAAGNRSAPQVFHIDFEKTSTYPVTADTYVDIRYPNTNFNSSTEKGGLHLKTPATGNPTNRKVYLSFDLSENTEPYIKKAVIELLPFELMGNDRTTETVSIYEVPAFNEATLTWGNAPENGEKVADATYERKGHRQPIYLDISQYMNRKLAALTSGETLDTVNLVLQIENGHDQKGAFLISKEVEPQNAAKILITEGLPAPVLTVHGIEDHSTYYTDILSDVEITAVSVSESVSLQLDVKVNGQSVASKGADLFDIPLQTGANHITVVATDSERNETRVEYTVTKLIDVPVGTYYVDSIAGDDNNDGTSETTAWKTLEKLNAVEFKPGSSILFKRGSIWNGQFRPHGSGTPESPIVVDAYGEASDNKPIINGNGISHLDTGNTIAEGAVHLYNLSAWELNNLEVTNEGSTIPNVLRAGIMVVAGGAGFVEHIRINNVYVHNVNSGTDAAKFSGGILFKGDTVDEKGNITNIPSGFNHILVENSHVKDVAIEGIRTKIHRNGQDTTNIKGTDIVFRNNLVEDVYGDGIVLAEVSAGGLIEKNIVRKHSKNSVSRNYAGLWLYETNAVLIQHNEVYEGVHGYNDGEAFDFDINVTNSIYQYNYSHHNRGGFLLTMTSAGAGNIFRYNISKNDGQGTEIFFCMNDRTAIYNNTIYIGEGYNVRYLINEGNLSRVSNMFFKNNIVQVDGNLEKYSPIAQAYNAPNVSHNLFYPAEIASLAGSPNTYASLVTADPLLADPAAPNEVMNTWTQEIWDRNIAKFKLQQGSPAIDAGVVIAEAGDTDMFGTPLYNGAAPDIGAHEFVPMDKTSLGELIIEAQELHASAVEGTEPGQYPVGAKEILNDAIIAAQALFDDETAAENEVASAIERLNAALAAFRSAVIVEETDFEKLRKGWLERLTGNTDVDHTDAHFATALADLDQKVKEIWNGLIKSSNRTTLWNDLNGVSNSAHIYDSYARIFEMARAYSIMESQFYQNETLKEDIVAAMDWMYANLYNESKSYYGNWYHWEIGVPRVLNDIVVLMYDHLTSQQINNYMKTIDRFNERPDHSTLLNRAETGANMMDKAFIIILRGINEDREDKIALGINAVAEDFKYVKSGNGFYEDGSMVYHNDLAYTGGYGLEVISRTADIVQLLYGSAWQITDPRINLVYDWILQSFEPVVYKGNLMDMVKGRGISRKGSENMVKSALFPILRLAVMADQSMADKSAEIQRMLKEWVLSSDATLDYYDAPSLHELALLKQLLDDRSIERRGDNVQTYMFSGMDRAVHLRENYAFGISMFSNRISAFTKGNNENLKGWHTGSGMTYLYNDDLTQYKDDFWPTVDSFRLPGTTTDGSGKGRTPGEWQQYRNTHSWVGGSTLDDMYGAVGMQFSLQGVTGSDLQGKKSWFLFDDEIVALGAGIGKTSAGADQVETIVENRKLNDHGDNALTINGELQSSTLGWSEAIADVNWAHLAGNVSGADIGYYFVEPSQIFAKRETRTGSWRDINTYDSSNPSESISKNYASLAFQHGLTPSDAKYGYVLLPGKNAASTEGYYNTPDIEVLSNTATVQAVKENTLGITGINFWQPATLGKVRAHMPSSVMIKEIGNQITISVSDPSHIQQVINLDIASTALAVVKQDAAIEVVSLEPFVELKVNTANAIGRSFTIVLDLDPNAEVPEFPEIPELRSHLIADAHVTDGNNSGTNYGSAQALAIKSDATGYARKAYLKFDYGVIDPSRLASAKLRFYILGVNDDPSRTISLYSTATDWDEASINWSNAPQAGTLIGQYAVTRDDASTWYEIDVTDYIQAQAENSLVSFLIVNEGVKSGKSDFSIASKEALTNHPQLVLVMEEEQAADKTGLEGKITTAQELVDGADAGTEPGQYPLAAIEALEAAILVAQEVIDNTMVTQAEVDEAVATLESAIEVFTASVNEEVVEPEPTVDKAGLEDAITAAQKLVDGADAGTEPGQYPLAAIEALEAAILVAQEVIDNTMVTQAEVDEAVATLESAIEVFTASVNEEVVEPEPTVNKAALEDAITEAQELVDGADAGTEPGQYPAAAMEALEAAILVAQEVVNNAAATQAEVDEAVAMLESAIEAFEASVNEEVVEPEPTVNKAALEDAITASQELVDGAIAGSEPGQYPVAAIEALEEAIAAAQEVVDSATVTQTEVDEAIATLESAIEVFEASINEEVVEPEPTVNKAALEDAITEAQELVDGADAGTEPGQYPIAAIAALEAAIAVAQEVIDSATATQAEVDEAVATLESAIEVFEASINEEVVEPEPTVNKAKLEDAITAAQELVDGADAGTEPGQYPIVAIEALEAAIAAAQEVVDNATVTQAEVDEAVAALESAIEVFEASVNEEVVEPEPTVNKVVLEDTITEAQELVDGADAGTEPGQYPVAAIKAMEAAIAAAQEVIDSTTATQAEVDEAVAMLESAIDVFTASINVEQGEIDTTAPTWPSNSLVLSTNVTRTSLTLIWTLAEDNVAVTGYKVTWEGGNKEIIVPEGVNRIELTELPAATTYAFKIEALDAAGNWSENGPSLTVRTRGSSSVPPVNPQPQPDPEPEQPVDPEPPVEPEEPVQPEQPQVEFTDVPTTHWAAAAINRAAALGIVKGNPDHSFKPNAATTRAEFITMLANAFKWQGEQAALSFKDNDKIGAWAQEAIAQGIERGVITGYTDGNFRPNQEITRAEMIVMLARALGIAPSSIEQTGFVDDAVIPAWSKGAVEALREQGLLTGRSNNSFAPNEAATRSEALVIIMRVLEKI